MCCLGAPGHETIQKQQDLHANRPGYRNTYIFNNYFVLLLITICLTTQPQFAPPSVADPPYAAGGGALLGVAVGVGGVLRGPNAFAVLRGFVR